MKHEFDVTPLTYARLADGSQTFLDLDHDREVQCGDVLVLKEFDRTRINSTDVAAKGYTGSKNLEFRIGFVSARGIVSLLPMKKARG